MSESKTFHFFPEAYNIPIGSEIYFSEGRPVIDDPFSSIFLKLFHDWRGSPSPYSATLASSSAPPPRPPRAPPLLSLSTVESTVLTAGTLSLRRVSGSIFPSSSLTPFFTGSQSRHPLYCNAVTNQSTSTPTFHLAPLACHYGARFYLLHPAATIASSISTATENLAAYVLWNETANALSIMSHGSTAQVQNQFDMCDMLMAEGDLWRAHLNWQREPAAVPAPIPAPSAHVPMPAAPQLQLLRCLCPLPHRKKSAKLFVLLMLFRHKRHTHAFPVGERHMAHERFKDIN
jgi:hypothetical protein